jgi:mannose-6-phosphate isomerase-like protein (cupin superfamily)
MEVKNIGEAKDWFSVLQTGKQVQTAVMTLTPGQSSGEKPEAHKNSEQVLLVLDGEVLAEVEEEKRIMRKGDVVLIPAGTKHKFTNQSAQAISTFNTYSPPEY